MANWGQYYQTGYPVSSNAYIQQQPVQYPLMSELRPEDFSASTSYPPDSQSQAQPNPPFTITQYAGQSAPGYGGQQYGNQQYGGQYAGYYGASQGYPSVGNQGRTNLVNVPNQRHVNQADPRQNRAVHNQGGQSSNQGQSRQAPNQGSTRPSTNQGDSRTNRWGQEQRSSGSSAQSGQRQQQWNSSQSSTGYGSQQQRSQPPQTQQRSQPSSQSQPRSQPPQPQQRSQPPPSTQQRSQPPPSTQQRSQPQSQQKSEPSSETQQRSQLPAKERSPTPSQAQQGGQTQAQQRSQPSSQTQQGSQISGVQQTLVNMAVSDDMEISDGEEEKPKQSAGWENCDVCGINFRSEQAYRMHCTGMLHTQKIAAKSESKQEKADQIDLTKDDEEDFTKDVEIDWTQGYFKKSGETLTSAGIVQKPSSISNKKDFYCKMCDKRFLGGPEMWDNHIVGKNHCKLMLKLQLELGFKAFEAKYGEVECGLSIMNGPVETASEVMNYTDVPVEEKEKYRQFVFRCGVMNDYQCSICNMNLHSVDRWVTHIQSKKHFKKFIFYLTKIKDTAEDFWQECGNLPGVYPGKIKDAIPTEGIVLKDWVRQTFGVQGGVPVRNPSEERPFEGIVTQLRNNFGVINDSIFFDLSDRRDKNVLAAHILQQSNGCDYVNVQMGKELCNGIAKSLNLQLRDKVKGVYVPSPNTSFKLKAVKLEAVRNAQAKIPPLMGTQPNHSGYPPRPSAGGYPPRPHPGGAGDNRAQPPGKPDPYGRDPYGRPYPDDRRPAYPHDPYYDYYYRRPYPNDPYYRPPHPDDRRPLPPGHPDDRRPPLPDPNDPYRRPYPDDPYYRAPYPPHPDDRRPPPPGHPDDRRPPPPGHPDDRRPPPPDPNDPYRRPYPDEPYYRAPHPDDRRPPPPDPNDPYRRPYPDDPYYRTPYPDDRRPPLPHPDDRRPPPLLPEDAYRRPYPDDPYYRPPHPDDPYYRPSHPDGQYRRAPGTHPDDPYRRPEDASEDYVRRPDERVPPSDFPPQEPQVSLDPPKVIDYAHDPNQRSTLFPIGGVPKVDIPGIDISEAEDRAYRGLNFESTPGATNGGPVPTGVPPPDPLRGQAGTQSNPTAVFSIEELRKLQDTLKKMEAAKDDPFKQLALAAQLRLLQDKQKEAKEMAKVIPLTQSQALKKLSGVMSDEQMEQLKKEMMKLQKKGKGKEERKREERKSDTSSSSRSRPGKSNAQKQIEDSIMSEFQASPSEGREEDKRRVVGDKMPPWRSAKQAPWDGAESGRPKEKVDRFAADRDQDRRQDESVPWDRSPDRSRDVAPWEKDDREQEVAPWEKDEGKAPWETGADARRSGGGRPREEAHWEAEDKARDAPWENDNRPKNSAPWESDEKDAPWENDNKPKSASWNTQEASDAPWDSDKVRDAPWEADEKAEDAGWETEDKNVKSAPWESDAGDAPWESGNNKANDVNLVTSDSKIMEARSRPKEEPWEAEDEKNEDPWSAKGDTPWELDDKGNNAAPWNAGNKDTSWESPEKPDNSITPARKFGGDGPNEGKGVALITPDSEAKIMAARKLGRGKPDEVALVTPDIEAKIKAAREQAKRGERARQEEETRRSVSKEAPWDAGNKPGDVTRRQGDRARESPWSDKGSDVTLVTSDNEARIREARKQGERASESGDEAKDVKSWRTGDEPKGTAWRSEEEIKETAWRSGSKSKDVVAPWDTGRKVEVIAPWDLDRKKGKVANPWDSDSNGRVATAPWESDNRDKAANPWDSTSKAKDATAPWDSERRDKDVAPWDEDRRTVVIAPWEKETKGRNESPPRSLPAQAPWERDMPKKPESLSSTPALGAPPPWASKVKDTEIEELAVTSSDVQAAKRAPWNRGKEDSDERDGRSRERSRDRGHSHERRRSRSRERHRSRDREHRSHSRDDWSRSPSSIAPWDKKRNVKNLMGDVDYRALGPDDRPPSPPSLERDVMGGMDRDYRAPHGDVDLRRDGDSRPPWQQKRAAAAKGERGEIIRAPGEREAAIEAVKQFLITYEDFHRQGGSHLTFEQLAPQVRDLVTHIREATYNSMHDVISTVHLLLALDPQVTNMLTEYSPPDLRCLVETRSKLQIQAMEILSVSVRHLVKLHSAQAGGGGSGAKELMGEKRRAPPPWGKNKHGQEKRPRY